MAGSDDSPLPTLIDRKGLADRGLTRKSIDHLFDRLTVVRYPGQRKIYLKLRDVLEYEAQHTYDGRTKVPPR